MRRVQLTLMHENRTTGRRADGDDRVRGAGTGAATGSSPARQTGGGDQRRGNAILEIGPSVWQPDQRAHTSVLGRDSSIRIPARFGARLHFATDSALGPHDPGGRRAGSAQTPIRVAGSSLDVHRGVTSLVRSPDTAGRSSSRSGHEVHEVVEW